MAAPHALKLFEEVDLIVAPTLLKEAVPVDLPMSQTWRNVGGNAGPGNLFGWPSMSLPMGFGPVGLPLGLEIMAPSFAEETILALAVPFQQETDWHRKRPPLK